MYMHRKLLTLHRPLLHNLWSLILIPRLLRRAPPAPSGPTRVSSGPRWNKPRFLSARAAASWTLWPPSSPVSWNRRRADAPVVPRMSTIPPKPQPIVTTPGAKSVNVPYTGPVLHEEVIGHIPGDSYSPLIVDLGMGGEQEVVRAQPEMQNGQPVMAQQTKELNLKPSLRFCAPSVVAPSERLSAASWGGLPGHGATLRARRGPGGGDMQEMHLSGQSSIR